MAIIRTILAILISISLVFAPVASSFAAPNANGMEKMAADAGAGRDGMDCDKAMGRSTDSDCKCCDIKSMCPDQPTCMTKCGKLLGVARPLARVGLLVSLRYLPAAPEKPPNRQSPPPSPPPRS